jgi:hypothetical protein
MSELRLGDVIDDYCIKCRRLTNHSIVSMMNGAVAKVRCRSCYHDHDYLHETAPPSKKELQKKAELFNAVLSSVEPAAVAEAEALPEIPAAAEVDEPPPDELADEPAVEEPVAVQPRVAAARKAPAAKKKGKAKKA